MRSRLLPLLAVFSLFASVLLPPPRARTQEREGAAAGASGYHALVIGNNAYVALPKLKTAEDDAREVAALLKEFYGFETRLLLNATRQQIVSALFAYRQTLGPEANLLVYYAGHGINDKEADKAYWLPVDATRDDDSNWISADDITTRLRAIPARHVLVISDSCYSGTLTRGLGEALPPPNARDQFLQRMMAGRSRTLMSSGGDEPVADSGGGGRHSVFANALLRGLRDMDKGKFTAAELFRFHVEERVAGRAQQTPEYNPLRNSGHEGGDFVFVKVKTDGRTVEVTVNAPAPRVDPAQQELAFWTTIQNSADAEDFKDYLTRYPNGTYAGLARRRVAALTAPPPAGGAARDVPDEAGDYLAAESGLRISVAIQAGNLTLTVPGQPTYALERAGERRYRLAGQPDFFVTFRAAKDDPRGTELYLEQPQGNILLKRVNRAAAPPGEHPAGGEFTVPNGTTLVATLNNDLFTRNAREGDRFTVTVRTPAQYEGAVIEGTISNVQRAGRVTGRSQMTLSFDAIRLRDGGTRRFEGIVDGLRSAGGESVRVDNEGAEPGKGTAKDGADKVGTSSAIGAIIGAIAGGGKGAAIGAAIGGGAGGGKSVIVQAGGDLELRSGAEITIRATEPKKQ